MPNFMTFIASHPKSVFSKLFFLLSKVRLLAFILSKHNIMAHNLVKKKCDSKMPWFWALKRQNKSYIYYVKKFPKLMTFQTWLMICECFQVSNTVLCVPQIPGWPLHPTATRSLIFFPQISPNIFRFITQIK